MTSRPRRAQTVFPRIALVDKTTSPIFNREGDANPVDLAVLAAALQAQLDNDFEPVWGYSGTVYVTDAPTASDWQIVFLDDADAAAELGFHELTLRGQPISKVFVASTLDAGQKVSVTASHELLEMLIDPGAQMWAQNRDGLFYAYEVCDAVEEVEYPSGGLPVSDFVYPAFFENWRQPRSVKFDFCSKISRPFETLRRGYQIVSNGGGAIGELFGSRAKLRNFCDVEDRTMHRSEYRTQRTLAARGAGQGAASSGCDEAWRAALRHYARHFLELAATGPGAQSCGTTEPRSDVDPLGPGGGSPGRRPGDIDPLCPDGGIAVWQPGKQNPVCQGSGASSGWRSSIDPLDPGGRIPVWQRGSIDPLAPSGGIPVWQPGNANPVFAGGGTPGARPGSIDPLDPGGGIPVWRPGGATRGYFRWRG